MLTKCDEMNVIDILNERKIKMTRITEHRGKKSVVMSNGLSREGNFNGRLGLKNRYARRHIEQRCDFLVDCNQISFLA